MSLVCHKVPYDSKEAANKDIVHIRNQNRRYSKHLGKAGKAQKKITAYQCCYCGKWHLTTQRQRKRKWER